MKKLLLGILCLSFGVHTHLSAQPFNKNYAYSDASGPMNGSPRDLINAWGQSCILGTLNYVYYSNPSNFYLQVTDFSGSSISLLNQYLCISGVGSQMNAQKVIRNSAGDYLIAGYFSSPSIATNPFVVKILSTGSVAWAFVYNSSTLIPPNNFNENFARVNIVESINGTSNQRAYIISTPSNEGASSPHPNDAYLNVFKIDDNGSLLWNYKYSPTVYGSYNALSDNPSALTKVNNDYYFISGTRVEIVDAIPNYSLFYLAIDGSGNIIKNYKKVTMPATPTHEDAVYNADSIYLTYTMGNQHITTTTPNSFIALTKLDLNLNQYFTKYYSNTKEAELYGNSIDLTANGSCIIGCYASESTHSSNAILEVLGNGTKVFFKKYNWLSTVSAGTRRNIINYDNGTTENFAFLSDYSGTSASTIRLFSTDIFGQTCGSIDSALSTTTYPLTPTDILYSSTPYSGQYGIAISVNSVSAKSISCDTSSPGNKAAYDHIASGDVKIYPTLLQAYNYNTVFLELNATNACTLKVRMLSIDGRQLFTQNLVLNKGFNKVSCNIPYCQPGNYILTTQSSNAECNKITRVTAQ